jgi:hypothetical protein
MRFTEGKGDYHVHNPISFSHKFKILSANLQSFIGTQKANECKRVDGMERPTCLGSTPLMYRFRFRTACRRTAGIRNSFVLLAVEIVEPLPAIEALGYPKKTSLERLSQKGVE